MISFDQILNTTSNGNIDTFAQYNKMSISESKKFIVKKCKINFCEFCEKKDKLLLVEHKHQRKVSTNKYVGKFRGISCYRCNQLFRRLDEYKLYGKYALHYTMKYMRKNTDNKTANLKYRKQLQKWGY